MITFGFRNKFSGLFRALAATIVGIIMVSVPQTALIIVVKVIAALLIASGVVSLVFGFINRANGALALMGFNTVINILLGILIFANPEMVAKFAVVLIGIVLLVLGLFQIAALVSASNILNLSFWVFILPCICAGGGALLLFNPFETASTLTLVAGIAVLVYGVSELLSSWKMSRAMHEYEIRFNEEKNSGASGKQEYGEMRYDDIKDAEFEKVDDQTEK